MNLKCGLIKASYLWPFKNGKLQYICLADTFTAAHPTACLPHDLKKKNIWNYLTRRCSGEPVASQQQSHSFDPFLCGVCTFSSCLRGFSPDSPATVQ